MRVKSLRVKSLRVNSFITSGVALAVSFLFLFPGLWLILSSFKSGSELFSFPLHLFPKQATFMNYREVWLKMAFPRYMANSFIVAVSATFLTVLFSSMSGFALAKYRTRFMEIAFLLLLATTMLPTEVIMAPSFEMILRLGLYNSLLGLIVPAVYTMTGVFLMRQFYLSVPDSLIESARIDGASELRIFTGIMIPLARPIIAILSILSFRWRWNDYVWPLIVIDDPDKYTLQLALRNLVGEMAIDWTSLLSASVISLIPVLLVFVFFQKKIMNANTSSGVKG
jgi:alpha-1,4-digalacturonate transport system permease protein